MTYLQRLIANALIFISLSVLFPDHVYVESLMMAITASFVLSILNTLVKPILILLSLPLNIMTLGLFSFVISAGMPSQFWWLSSWRLSMRSFQIIISISTRIGNLPIRFLEK